MLLSLRRRIRSITALRTIYGAYKYVIFSARLAREERRHFDKSTPPPRLRHRVHGQLGERDFLATGERVAADLRNLLQRVGRDAASFTRILDFGCGCGRVARFLPAIVTGTDIDPEAIAWCRAHLAGHWDINGFMPPTAYADAEFDFIYAISVFTHLDELMQLAWLAELRRISKPGAVLILTLHGAHTTRTLSAAERRQIETDGFFYLVSQTGKLHLSGLPDFYQTMFHSKRYVESVWGRFFTVLEYVERGVNDHHDAVILRRE